MNDTPDVNDEPSVPALKARIESLEQRLAETTSFLRRVAAPPVASSDAARRTRIPFDPGDVELLYARRFPARERAKKSLIWSSLTEFFSRRFPAETHRVLDLAAGRGEFIHHVKAAYRVALDLNPGAFDPELEGITLVQADATRLHEHFDDDSFDLVFCSNFLEHLYDKDQVHLVFREVHHVLRPGGRFLILQPDVRWVGGDYWNFIDHRLALTADAVAEALELANFKVVERIDRFLPYTTKSRLSNFYQLTPLYLRLPLAWRFFGKQAFLVAEKRG